MTNLIEIASRIKDPQQLRVLSGVVAAADVEFKGEGLTLKTARKIAYREGELDLSPEVVDGANILLSKHFGLADRVSGARSYLREVGCLVGMEERYGVEGIAIAGDFKTFNGNFKAFSTLAYAATILGLVDRGVVGVKEKKVDQFIKKAQDLAAEAVVGFGSLDFANFASSEDSLRAIIAFEANHSLTVDALRGLTKLTYPRIGSKLRVSQILIKRR